MAAFWNRSWEQIDKNRIRNYIHTVDSQPDNWIRYLLSQNVKTVCDAGCGCGIYTRKLAASGFTVSGFDVSAHAVEIARNLLEQSGECANLKTASVLMTGYPDNSFDCVLSRDVLDHMAKADAATAVAELYRITRPGGILLLTLDGSDDDYESQPHTVNPDGDYLFTSGKWEGMVFHPYREEEIPQLIPSGAHCQLQSESGSFTVILKKGLLQN